MSDIIMCDDQHFPNHATCYRAQAEPEPDQIFWAFSPRDLDVCIYYAPMQHTDGTSALLNHD